MGVLWALTSGTGVAVALLVGSVGPLIGVAISASLLPPLVNCVTRTEFSLDKVPHTGISFLFIVGYLLGSGLHLADLRRSQDTPYQRGTLHRELHVPVRLHQLRPHRVLYQRNRLWTPDHRQCHLHLYYCDYRAQDQRSGFSVYFKP